MYGIKAINNKGMEIWVMGTQKGNTRSTIGLKPKKWKTEAEANAVRESLLGAMDAFNTMTVTLLVCPVT